MTEKIIRPGVIDRRGFVVPDYIFDIARQQAAIEEMFGAEAIGARPCPSPHGAGGTFPHEVEMTNIIPAGCPSCGAAV